MLIRAGRVGAVGRTRVTLSDVNRLLSYMTTRPDATRAGHIATLINTLDAVGIWKKLAVLYVTAAHDAQAAILNWRNPSRNPLTLVNSPLITTDRGLKSDGSTSYANLTLNPAANANGLLQQNDMAMGVWITTAATGTSGDFGNTNSQIFSRSPAADWRIQTTSNQAGGNQIAGVSNITRLVSWSRLSSTSYKVFYRGSELATVSVASTGFSANMFLGRVVAAQYSTAQIGAAFAGAGLTDAEMLALSNALDTYMTAIGAM